MKSSNDNDSDNTRRKKLTVESLEFYAAKNERFPVAHAEELLTYVLLSTSSSSSTTVTSTSSLYIIDVRTKEERNISYIPSSISQEDFEKLDDNVRKSARLIIPYCTIGLRSGNYCARLAENGYEITKLKNGAGIISWSHIDGPLVRVEKGVEVDTKKVHCFGSPWKLMLNTNYEPVVFSTWNLFWFGISQLLQGRLL